jgi:hypothetical protein
MKQLSLCLIASLILVSNSSANAVEAQGLKVSRPGDLEKNCDELLREAFLMRQIIYETQDIKNDSEFKSHGITAAGAVGSLVVGTATGGLGLAAMGFMLDREADEEGDRADRIQDVAEQRRTFMAGIFNAKSCQGPMATALKNPKRGPELDLNAIKPASGEETAERLAQGNYNQ